MSTTGPVASATLIAELPELGQSALFCVTELLTAADIDRLVAALTEVLS